MATRLLSPFVRIGQVIQKSVRDDKNLVKVRIQKMKFDKRLLMVSGWGNKRQYCTKRDKKPSYVCSLIKQCIFVLCANYLTAINLMLASQFKMQQHCMQSKQLQKKQKQKTRDTGRIEFIAWD